MCLQHWRNQSFPPSALSLSSLSNLPTMIISNLFYLLFLSFLTAIKAKFISLSKTLLLFREEVSLGLLQIGVCVCVCITRTDVRRPPEGFFVKMLLCIYFFMCYDTVWTVRLISIPHEGLSFVWLDSRAVNKW